MVGSREQAVGSRKQEAGWRKQAVGGRQQDMYDAASRKMLEPRVHVRVFVGSRQSHRKHACGGGVTAHARTHADSHAHANDTHARAHTRACTDLLLLGRPRDELLRGRAATSLVRVGGGVGRHVSRGLLHRAVHLPRGGVGGRGVGLVSEGGSEGVVWGSVHSQHASLAPR